jgi:hypothetical protein
VLADGGDTERADVAKIGNSNNLLEIISQVAGSLNNPYYWGGWPNKCKEVIVISVIPFDA